MDSDTSKRLILVLLVLVIIASFLSTFTMVKTLEAINSRTQVPVSEGKHSSATVALSIIDPKDHKSDAAGRVMIDIEKPEGIKNG